MAIRLKLHWLAFVLYKQKTQNPMVECDGRRETTTRKSMHFQAQAAKVISPNTNRFPDTGDGKA